MFNTKIRAVFYSIIPSPYQRDLLYELSRRPEIDLKVFYLEPIRKPGVKLGEVRKKERREVELG
jgi:hypothetical protein